MKWFLILAVYWHSMAFYQDLGDITNRTSFEKAAMFLTDREKVAKVDARSVRFVPSHDAGTSLVYLVWADNKKDSGPVRCSACGK